MNYEFERVSPETHIITNAVQPTLGKHVPYCFEKDRSRNQRIKVNRNWKANNLRYADDTAIIGGTVSGCTKHSKRDKRSWNAVWFDYKCKAT